MQDSIGTTQTTINPQPSQLTTTNEVQSSTVSILSKGTNSTMTSITPSNSTHLNSQSTDSLNSVVSFNTEINSTLSTLSSTFEHISTSTESPLQPSSEYTSKITDELTTPSTTINDQYQTSAEMSSKNSNTVTNEVTMETNRLLSTSVDHNNLFVTSMKPSATIEIQSASLTSSDTVSNIHTIIPASTNILNVIITTQEVFEDKLSSTVTSDQQTTYLG
ncbi:unnamed protein product, partial [Rotaria sp. Silwood1]